MGAISGLLSIVLFLALPVGIIVGIVKLVRRSRGPEANLAAQAGSSASQTVPVVWDRFFLYILSFAGLMATLFALYSGMAVVLGLVVQHVATLGTLISTSDAKTQIAADVAALIVGVPLWLGCWSVVQRRAVREPEERQALERRLYLGAIFGVTALVSLFALHSLLQAVLELPGFANRLQSSKDALRTALELTVFGVAWLAFARFGWRERGPRSADIGHDLAVYAVAGFSLVFLAIGIGDAIHHLVMTLQDTAEIYSPLDVTNVTWTVWGGIAAWIIAGGGIWAAIWRYDLLRGGARPARIGYLYLVLAASVPPALVSAGTLGWEALRRAFGYDSAPNTWGFLADSLPLLVVASAIWAYHWAVVRRQASLFEIKSQAANAIAWPRRPAIAILSFVGLATATYGCIALVWLGLDVLFARHGGGGWWRDWLSSGLVTAGIGLAIWTPAWTLLQRAVSADPRHEGQALERRWLLVAILVAGALATVGFSVATLYQVLRGILQTTDANTLANGLKFGAAAAVTAALAAYHGMLLRRERSVRQTTPNRVRAVALIAPDAGPALAELRQHTGLQIDVLGYLSEDIAAPRSDLSQLQEQLIRLQGSERVLLILFADGGTVYAYSRTPEPALDRLVRSASPAPSAGGEAVRLGR